MANKSTHKVNKYDRFYFACEHNDLARAEHFLKKMTLKEVNQQYAPNNETVLHVATRKQHQNMIKLLLMYAADTQIRDINSKSASDLAETNETKSLFQRPKSSRFAFSDDSFSPIILPQHKLNCKSCSVINNGSMYEWELIDRNAAAKALEFRREFEAYELMDSKIWKKKLYSLNKSYLSAHLQDLDRTDSQPIRTWFESALSEQNPDYIVTAYSHSQQFSNMLNLDMARNVIHSLRNGCSQFSCQCLYETHDGTTTISSILLHHPNFKELDYQGEVYRGIQMSKQKLDHYKIGSRVITTTFLSTSTEPSVAYLFGGGGVLQPGKHSFFCTYKLTMNGRTAINISKLSRHSEEKEILILPYSSFLITKIEEEENATNIYLEEQSLQEIAER